MLDVKSTVILVVDVQGKLAQIMYEREKTIKNIQAMIKLAQILDIPLLWTEQAPFKIGFTIPEIAELLSKNKPIEKKTFSCMQNEMFQRALEKLRRKQIVMCGIETHVCVYQTTAELVAAKYEVQVVADAVSSRTAENKCLGLERIKQAGGIITATEIVACELLKVAEGEKFKAVLQLIK